MPPTPKTRVAIIIVSWNGLTHLPSCLESVVAQRFRNFSTLVVDNGSADGTVAWLQEQYPHVHLLRNTRNIGFCRANNQGIRLVDSDYILLLNQDAVLTPEWLERGVQWLDAHPDAGAWGGKLLRFSYDQEELKSIRISDIIDSTGLAGNRSRHFYSRGSGQPDTGQYHQSGEVFGLDGACILIRRSALESVRFKNEYLDEDFFAYKDDVDLCWRLRRMGWSIWYDGQALAYHHRSIRGQSAISDKLVALNHRSRNRFNSYHSYRNHWLMLMKNESWSSVWRDLPWIVWYECKKFIFLLFTTPSSLRGLTDAWRWRGKMKAKAAVIRHQAKRTPLEVRQWFLPTHP